MSQEDKAKRSAERFKALLKNAFDKSGGTDKDAWVKQMYTRYLIERFAVRLTRCEGARALMLKGGIRLHWDPALSNAARVTNDIDVHTFEAMTHAEIEALFKEAAALDVGDDLKIELGRSAVLEHVHGEHKGLRFKLIGNLGGTRFTSQVDIGIGGERPLGLMPLEIKPMIKDQLGGTIQAQPLEYVVAEKLHAICYHGMENTRMKDFRDIVVLIDNGLDPKKVRAAVVDTFRQRGLNLPTERPEGLSLEFGEEHQADWARWLNDYRITGFSDDFVEVLGQVHERVVDILMHPDNERINAANSARRGL